MPTSVIWKKSERLPTDTSARPEEHNYIDGRLFSYVEMLAILRASARDTGLDPKTIGL
ncbi:hypothetical protein [Spirosoma sp. KNUC1025]|uniref:hypothetical protein n=1 Tax=Spirosoma sp. KNUC1025 TaxID=2894082 RepID=UPI00386A7153|nr:hypothetical protein LN737_15615 [Spirosoma sp. KNUC1025]